MSGPQWWGPEVDDLIDQKVDEAPPLTAEQVAIIAAVRSGAVRGVA